jgi:hypothetical protein
MIFLPAIIGAGLVTFAIRLSVELSGVSQRRHFTPANRFVLADVRSNSVLDEPVGVSTPPGPNPPCAATLAAVGPACPHSPPPPIGRPATPDFQVAPANFRPPGGLHP